MKTSTASTFSFESLPSSEKSGGKSKIPCSIFRGVFLLDTTGAWRTLLFRLELLLNLISVEDTEAPTLEAFDFAEEAEE